MTLYTKDCKKHGVHESAAAEGESGGQLSAMGSKSAEATQELHEKLESSLALSMAFKTVNGIQDCKWHTRL